MVSIFVCWLTLAVQAPAGEIRLTVQDSSGVPTRAVAQLNGARYETDAQGQRAFRNLAYGRYQVRVSQDGFAPEEFVVTVNSPTPVLRTVKLTIGTAATSITVVGTTPLSGVGVAPGQLPVTVQSAAALDLERTGATNLSDFLNRRLNGVFVNEIQGNPFQPDVNYRGYTASPLLGTPQGLSVYLDGVRMNEPFGDVVSWDLIPRVAIAEVTLMPGSNPLFGLNTLGGALAVDTKSGRTHPGTSLQISGGSFGRRVTELEHGGANAKGLDWYLAGNLFFEDGWRQASPSNVRQVFSRLGWKGERTTLGISTSYASNLLNGNGLQELRLLQRDYRSAYTLHDATSHRAPWVNLTGRHSVTDKLSVYGKVYFRSVDTKTFNGDINEESLDQSVYQPNAAERVALAAAGFTGVPTSGATAANTPFPFLRCLGNVLLRDEPAEKCNGLINRGQSNQKNYGATGQLSWLGALAGYRHQITAGAAWDASSLGFRQTSELGYLNPNRTVTGTGAFGDGVTGGDVDGEPYDVRVILDGRIQTGSLYLTDTMSFGALTLTASGRFNRTVVNNFDRILPSGPGSLSGRHHFARFNPAVGGAYQLGSGVTTYFNYSEGSRAPTAIELGCADPENPCKLPNAMAGDPPLFQVVTRTFEAGLRGGGAERRVRWNLGWFHADNRNDILFIASPQSGYGYFKNFGRTQRKGVEGGVTGKVHQRVTLGANYTFLNASFESQEQVLGESNSSNDGAARGLDGLINVRPGNRIPLSPQHTGKAFAQVQATKRLSADLDFIAVSSAYARGNENNLHQADGTFYVGPGRSAGYGVLNGGARFAWHRRVELFLQATNLLNLRYYSAAQLGPAGFTPQGNFVARPFPAVSGDFPLVRSTFFAPGAPRAAWAGMRFRF